MSAWELPQSLTVGGKEYEIRTDFRTVLDIIKALNDPKLDDEWKTAVAVKILYPEWEKIPEQDLQEAAEKAGDFINAGMKDNGKKQKLMDWEQDAELIVPAVNKVIGQEVRALPYLHWWTFIGYYMEIGESTFSQVLSIRQKKKKGKKLEKWEAEFYRENKNLIDLKTHEDRPDKEKEALRQLFGIRK